MLANSRCERAKKKRPLKEVQSGVSYVLKVCVQLYEQEGSLCVFWVGRVPLVIGASHL